MRRSKQSVWSAVGLGLALMMLAGAPARGGKKPVPIAEKVAKAAQNPIAAVYSLQFQNDANFGIDPYNRTQDILNIRGDYKSGCME